MSRGKKLDIFIGASINDDSWTEVHHPSPPKSSNITEEPAKHILLFKKEKRRGKTVTLVGEFHRPKSELTLLLKLLKKKLGCGGTLKENWMEFQGDIKEKLRPLLTEEKFRFKNGH
ncbi:translation initiation factor [Sulfurimonas sp. SWIR-19]|uniref:translation initiation factor n=1 Tax=Sulfurimonas sp. SWIR-19 TaxID=2878390 RepID=UPI001CF1B558|nr:translation initiation factor [Sulfurimonas sp. SWIR-19]UCN00963.1 translation initiation factor [Sulfurimonas sp. SWIR-19]